MSEYEKGRSPRLDGRTKSKAGYGVSFRARLLIEKIFGWTKTIGGMRRSRYRGLSRTGLFATMAAAAFNLLRISNLQTA